MKISEMTTADIWQHIREDPKEMEEADNRAILTMKTAAVEYCKGYTGLTEEQLDQHEDITIAVLMLIADMYDNRQLQVDKNIMNKTAETILGMYCVNFL